MSRPAPHLVERFDVAALGRPERTPQGFMRVPAFLTRAGVFRYRRADGTTIREYRPETEVFSPASLRSLAAAPVTDLHPTEMVSPKNVRKLAIGHVSETARQDGRFVAGAVTIEDEAAIDLVERRERCEVSMGYRCRIDATPGTHDGEAYDVVQRDIVYNHAAIGPRNWGRAGGEVRLRLDHDDATDNDDGAGFRLDSEGALLTETIDAPAERSDDGEHMDVTTIRLDGIEVQVPKQSAQLIDKALAERDRQIQQLTAARDAQQGRADSLTTEADKLKAQLAAAEDPKRIDGLVNGRAQLFGQARRVLGTEAKLDGKSTREIHEAVLQHLDPKLELKGRSDEYVTARFDHALETLPADGGAGGADDRRDGLADLRRSAVDPYRGASGGGSQQRQDRSDPPPFVAPWQQPLGISKDAGRR